jgi:cytochrome P450
MMKLTLSIITRTMFGEEISESRKQKVADAVNETIARSSELLYSPLQLPMFLPTPANIRHKKALQTLDELVDEVLDNYAQQPHRYEQTMVGLLSAIRDGDAQPLPRKEIRDQMVTMLIAGHETTANALSWAWYLLANNPDAFDKIREEVRNVDFANRTPMELYRALTYTQQSIQETLRLYPPAWLILREANEDVEILGNTFVKGSSMLISPYTLHRNEKVFSNPLSFQPERFGAGISYPRFAYFPFGGGSRSCIGSTFAMMEATLIVAVMAGKVRLEQIGDQIPIPETSVSLRMKEDLSMRVRFS